MSLSSISAARSGTFWRETAAVDGSFPALSGDSAADTLIVGGGFTGLSTARELLARGVDCMVLEGNDIGWGASGRTGGFAVPRYKMNFRAIAQKFGDETAKSLFHEILEATDILADTISEFAIDCEYERNGHLTPAHSCTAEEALRADCGWLRDVAGDDVAYYLSADETAEMLGTDIYRGAYFDRRGGCMHPFNYVRGLAGELKKRGVAIFATSPVTFLERTTGGWLVRTPEATVKARCVIVATNGYSSSLRPGDDLYRRIVPVASSVLVTRPLDAEEKSRTLPCLLPVTDTRRLVNYFRVLPSGQLMFGGRGDITGKRDDPQVYHKLERQLASTFPHLEGVELHYRWSGMVAVTLDTFPHFGKQDEGLFYAMGYGGRGVALTHLMGRKLAAMACGETPPDSPMSGSGFTRVPFHAWRHTGMRIMERYYQLRDQLEK